MLMYMDSSTTTPWLHADHHHGGGASSPLSAAAQAQSNHHHLFASPAPSPSRNHGVITKNKKRRPRPSRRLPTTYINADAASFRTMVQQVTGASSSDAALPSPQEEEQDPTKVNASELFLTRPAPIKLSSSGRMGTEMLLPTLDTSAFLATCDGSSSLAADSAGGGPSCWNTASTGFPTLESWDHHAPLF